MNALLGAKQAARDAAQARRAELHDRGAGAARQAAAHALRHIGGLRDVRAVAAYLPFRSEIDPRPAMLALHGLGYRLCVPVIEAKRAPLRFRAWRPGVALAAGPFGVDAPAEGDWVRPDALLAPLLAFDRCGFRLGYGGGFYDRTLAVLRTAGPVTAIGFAYAGQEVAVVPRGEADARLDAVVTEAGLILPR